ncbi:MAG: VCBS repeat-containing protein [Betaproteobacteria bacterium]
MKIANSTVEMSSNHASAKKYELNEKLRSWIGNQRPDFEGTSRLIRQPSPPSTAVQISEAGKSVQSNEATAIQDSMNAVENDPIMRLIRAMIAALTGHEVKVFDAAELQSNAPTINIQDPNQVAQTTQPQSPQQSAGFGIEYDSHASYSEYEQTSFQASGIVQTTDGKEIAFSLAISMTRSYYEASDISIRLGDARKKQDPLVVNFNGTATQLTSQRFKFDLNSDGQSENINFATNGSGFLALDRNSDGKINNGSELFGASSGNGFADLALLDADHNGWIDENDAAYGQLRILTKDATGNDQLSTLKQSNIGALSVSATATPFELKEANNSLLGQIKDSGIFLRENGTAGTIQQVDLTV